MRLGLSLSVTGIGSASTPAPPEVTNISPNTGPTVGGTSVTITGTGFRNGATVIIGTFADSVVVVNSTTITCVTAAAGARGAVTVIVTNDDEQESVVPDGFTYVIAEWGGTTPIVDWNPVNASVTGADIDFIGNEDGLDTITLTGAASNKPTLVSASSHFNNKPAAAITGTQRFTHGDLGLTTNGPCTIYIVAKVLVDSGGNQYLWSTDNDDIVIRSVGALGAAWHEWFSTDATAILSDNASTSASVLAISLSGGTQRFYVNSATEEGNTTSAGVVFSGNGVIGTYYALIAAGTSLAGQMARFLAFNSLHNATVRGNIIAALKSLYGIA